MLVKPAVKYASVAWTWIYNKRKIVSGRCEKFKGLSWMYCS